MITTYAEPRFAPLPPTKQTKPTVNWTAITDQLRATPGQWAAIGTLPAHQSLGQRGIKLRRKGVETCTRSNGDGTATIWACYVGAGKAQGLPDPMIVPDDVMAEWFEVAS